MYCKPGLICTNHKVNISIMSHTLHIHTLVTTAEISESDRYLANLVDY